MTALNAATAAVSMMCRLKMKRFPPSLSDGLLGYEIKKPCPFLREDGQCEVEFCKPSECAAYPYTDRLGRMGSLLNIIASAEVCPVVYEMLEQLKDTYHFRKQY